MMPSPFGFTLAGGILLCMCGVLVLLAGMINKAPAADDGDSDLLAPEVEERATTATPVQKGLRAAALLVGCFAMGCLAAALALALGRGFGWF